MNLRDEIRKRVREALVRELDPSLDATPAAARPPARAGHDRQERASIITEDDVRRQLREQGRIEIPEGSRLTPLAEECVSRWQRSAARQPNPGHGSSQVAESSRAEPRTDDRGHATTQDITTPSSRSGARDCIAIGADHGGFALKQVIGEHLAQRGFEVFDCGTFDEQACDYPIFAQAVAGAVADGRAVAGVVVDGAGIGSAMAANKVPGVLAAHCHNTVEARNAREHNHARVVTLGSGIIGPQMAKEIVDRFLATPFGEGRHARRVALIEPNREVAR